MHAATPPPSSFQRSALLGCKQRWTRMMKSSLYSKRQCHEIFASDVFLWIVFPQAAENNNWVISSFFLICRDIRKSKYAVSVNDKRGKFATGVKDSGGKYCHQYRWCSWYWLIPIVIIKNFLIEEFSICQWCQWHGWGTLSCKYLHNFSKKSKWP